MVNAGCMRKKQEQNTLSKTYFLNKMLTVNVQELWKQLLFKLTSKSCSGACQ